MSSLSEDVGRGLLYSPSQLMKLKPWVDECVCIEPQGKSHCNLAPCIADHGQV